MSNNATRFTNGRRPDKNAKPKDDKLQHGPEPIFPVSIEDSKGNVIGDAQAIFQKKPFLKIYTKTKLKIDVIVCLKKRSVDISKEKYWDCVVVGVIKEGLKKNEYILIRK